MQKFCGKCGSKLNENELCPKCDKKQLERANENAPKKKSRLKMIVFTVVIFVVIFAAFFALDFFDVIPTGMSKSLGLKASGSFEIEADKDYVFASENEEYSVAFFCKPDVEFSSIELYRDDTFKSVSSFYVDGNYIENNDKESEDGIYSSCITIQETEEKTLKYHAVIKNGLRYYTSNTVEIEVKKDWTDDELSSMESADEAIQELLNKDEHKNKTFEQKADSVNSLLNELSDSDGDALIIADSICFDEEAGVYSFQYANGCLGCVSIEKDSEDNGLVLGNSSSSSTASDASSASEATNSSAAVSGNANAIIMYDWYVDDDEVLDFYEEYQEDWTSKGLDTELSVNPTVAQYGTQMANNGLVLIASHGSRYSVKKGVFKPSTTYSVVCTHEGCTKDLDKSYKFDINQKNIVRANTEEGKFYWILPEFFSSHYGNGELDNSIVLISSCYGFGKDDDIDYDLASNMTGASASVGFHNSVGIFKIYKLTEDKYATKGYGTLFMETIVDSLISCETIDTAFNKAKQIIGDTQYEYNSDYGYDCGEADKSVYPLISGSSEAKLSVSGYSEEYKVGENLIKVGDKYICSDGNAIYYKNSILEKGKKIVTKNNIEWILSDGQTVFFVVLTQSRYRTETFDVPRTIYSVNVDGSDLKEVSTTENTAQLLTYHKDCLYYYSFSDYGKGSLFKTDVLSGVNTDIGGDISNVSNYDYVNYIEQINEKLYFLSKSSDGRNNDTVISYDLATGETKNELDNMSINYCRGNYKNINLFCYTTDDKYVRSNQHLYTIGSNNVISTSAIIPSDLGYLQIINEDNSYALFFGAKDDDFNLYKFDIKTGSVNTIKNGAAKFKNKGYGVSNDLCNPDDMYFISGTLCRFNGNGLDVCECEYSPTYENYWIVDGFLVNYKFECYEIHDETVDYSKSNNNAKTISSDEATKIALEKAGGSEKYSAVYWKNVQYSGKEYYLINVKWKVDDGDGKFHYSHIGYMIVSTDGTDVKNVDYVNGQVQV